MSSDDVTYRCANEANSASHDGDSADGVIIPAGGINESDYKAGCVAGLPAALAGEEPRYNANWSNDSAAADSAPPEAATEAPSETETPTPA